MRITRLDPVASILLALGVVALVGAIFGAVVLLGSRPDATPSGGQPNVALSGDQVATILALDPGVDSAGAARPGDHVDVLGYFPRQVTGADSMTRVLLEDVAVLGVSREAGRIALTLAVPQDRVILLREAQAIGGRPFVTLRSAQAAGSGERSPAAITDRDVVARLVSVTRGAVAGGR